MTSSCRLLLVFLFTALILVAQATQGRGPTISESMHAANQLDLEGKGNEARVIFQTEIDSAPTPAARANAQRAMAMSWAFEGNCKKTSEYEDLVIAYWKSQESTSPENAFYQQGEMADEAARVCIDNGDIDTAYRLYQRGYELGIREPNIAPGRKAVWDFRWEHAQARVSARRGNKSEAKKHVLAAKTVIENLKGKDVKLYEQQMAFLPYLTGYVALYSGDGKTAVADLEKANQHDAFIQCLLGMAYEKLGDKERASEMYRKAAAVRGHNPPAAFARPFARKKLGMT